MKKYTVTNKNSGCKYTLCFCLSKIPMSAIGFEYGTEKTADYHVYYEESQDSETMDDFIKRVKKDVRTHEDL